MKKFSFWRRKKEEKEPVMGEKWVIRWAEYASDTYFYGSEITYEEDRVIYHNNIVPPATIIKKWYSKVRYQAQRIEPALPLIDGESSYQVVTHIECPEHQNFLLKLVYYDRYGNVAGEDILRDQISIFRCPLKTYSYEMQLINAGFTDMIFKSITIQEILSDEKELES